jgi:hypothetical protein
VKRTIVKSSLALLIVLSVAPACTTRKLDPQGTGTGGAGATAGTSGGAGYPGDEGVAGNGGTTGSLGIAGSSGTAGVGGARSTYPTSHRVLPMACSGVVTDAAITPGDAGLSDAGTPSCTQDTDCVSCANGQLGRCEGPFSTCVCDQCMVDGDCGATGVCACNGQTFGWSHTLRGNVCVPSNCRVDGDCGLGGFCSPTTDLSCGAFYGVTGYYCHTVNDQCINDTDCAAGTCRYSPQVGYWVCATGACAG